MGALAAGGASRRSYDRGWHPTSVCGGLGAAVVASRLLGLDAASRNRPRRSPCCAPRDCARRSAPPARALQVGMAAAAGVAAARLAAAGARVGLRAVASGYAGFSTAFGAAVAERGRRRQPGDRAELDQGLSLLPADAQLDRGGRRGARGRRRRRRRIEVSVHPLSLQAAPIDDAGRRAGGEVLDPLPDRLHPAARAPGLRASPGRRRGRPPRGERSRSGPTRRWAPRRPCSRWTARRPRGCPRRSARPSARSIRAGLAAKRRALAASGSRAHSTTPAARSPSWLELIGPR